jgi:hypothetical protein
MDIQSAITKRMMQLLKMVFAIFILLYFGTGIYFFVSGLLIRSGGGVLLGLACWGGIALFITPIWLVSELKTQTELLRYQNQLLRVLVEDSSRNHDVPPSKEAYSS